MVLYHATTEKRALSILKDKCIKKDVRRFYTVKESGDGYTTQGYVYLTNEITFAVYFANTHSKLDKSERLFIFKIELPDDVLEADNDELRIQRATEKMIISYGGELNCSLLEYKSCRVKVDINFDIFPIEYCIVPKTDDIKYLLINVGENYQYVVNRYTQAQKEFIKNIVWRKYKVD